MFQLLSRFVISQEAANLFQVALNELTNLNVRSMSDLYKNSDAYRRGYELGYRTEMARRKNEV
jgi:hypothetical protein